MVIALLIALASTVSAQAAPAGEQIERLYRAKRYADVIKLHAGNPAIAMESERTGKIVAASYERTRGYRKAYEVNSQLLRKFYARENRQFADEQRNNSVQPARYPAGFKNLYYSLYYDQSQLAFTSTSLKDLPPNWARTFESTRQKLELLEIQPAQVSERSEKVAAHLKYLEQKTFQWKFRVFLDYVSWQTEATLVGPSGGYSLLATNQGLSPGAGVSYQNGFYVFTSDLNLVYGSAGVSTLQGGPVYNQADVPAYGARLAVAGGLIVSASKAELGLRLSFWYISQDLTTPSVAGYSVEQSKKLSQTLSIYSRWHFGGYFLQTDFGRYLGRPATAWAIGFGRGL